MSNPLWSTPDRNFHLRVTALEQNANISRTLILSLKATNVATLRVTKACVEAAAELSDLYTETARTIGLDGDLKPINQIVGPSFNLDSKAEDVIDYTALGNILAQDPELLHDMERYRDQLAAPSEPEAESLSSTSLVPSNPLAERSHEPSTPVGDTLRPGNTLRLHLTSENNMNMNNLHESTGPFNANPNSGGQNSQLSNTSTTGHESYGYRAIGNNGVLDIGPRGANSGENSGIRSRSSSNGSGLRPTPRNIHRAANNQDGYGSQGGNREGQP